MPSRRATIKSLAKVNLDLRVLNQRADGFHELRTVFHTISLADTIDAHVERVSSLAGPLATVLQAASPDQLATLRRTAAGFAAPYVTDSGLVIPGQALLVSGRR